MAAHGAAGPVASVSRTGAQVNLFGLDRQQLREQFALMGEKPFRADQVMQWIYRRGHDRFDEMTNLSRELRIRLAERFVIRTPELVTEQRSADGTRKWVLRLDGGQAIETVYIPEEGRATLCISSQVGCALDCAFCSTAQQGLNRNMTTAEIVAQVWFAAKTLGGDFYSQHWSEPVEDSAADDTEDTRKGGRVISNIVFMGMGEPLANYGAVVPAIRILLDDFGFGLSKRRVTVSTSGLVPFIDRLRDDVDTALAVSLHAPTDELRDQIVPINRKYPIADLMAACRRYTEGKDRKTHIVYEYVMLDGVNDRPEHARALVRLLAGMPAKVNLIPFNPFPDTPFKRSKPETIAAFAKILRDKRLIATVRRTRGDDIDAACGQLVGKVQSRQKNRLRGVPVVIQ